jgi:hypothetical protein
MSNKHLDLMKIQVLRPYYDRSYTSKSGKNVRFVVGRFKQSALEQNGGEGTLRYTGAMVVINDNTGERESIEVFRDKNEIHQLRLRKSRLSYLIRARTEPEEFFEELSMIANSALDIDEENTESDPSVKREPRIDDARKSY